MKKIKKLWYFKQVEDSFIDDSLFIYDKMENVGVDE